MCLCKRWSHRHFLMLFRAISAKDITSYSDHILLNSLKKFIIKARKQ